MSDTAFFSLMFGILFVVGMIGLQSVFHRQRRLLQVVKRHREELADAIKDLYPMLPVDDRRRLSALFTQQVRDLKELLD